MGQTLDKKSYTKYEFGGLSKVGGFNYISNNLDHGSGPYKIHKVVAYMPIKEHFVRKDASRKDARYNTNQTCSPSDVWTKSNRFLHVTVSLF
jgi:hypothetical protein